MKDKGYKNTRERKKKQPAAPPAKADDAGTVQNSKAEKSAEDLARMARAREHLIDFACYIDPAAAHWYRAPHLVKIAEYLERIERAVALPVPPAAPSSAPEGQASTPAAAPSEPPLRRLIVETPPRHWKSSLVSDKFPAWFLGRQPQATVLLASYAVSLAVKFARSVRDTIESNQLYQELFPEVRVRPDTRE